MSSRQKKRARREAAQKITRLERFQAHVFGKLLEQPDFLRYLESTWSIRPLLDPERRLVDVAVERRPPVEA